MHTPYIKARGNRWIQPTVSESDAETYGDDRPTGNVVLTIGHVDLPAFFSNGEFYIQAPLPHIFEAFGESLSEFVRDLEIGVSAPRGTTLSSAYIRGAVHRARMALKSMARGCG